MTRGVSGEEKIYAKERVMMVRNVCTCKAEEVTCVVYTTERDERWGEGGGRTVITYRQDQNQTNK
jgi:hypothetical protein